MTRDAVSTNQRSGSQLVIRLSAMSDAQVAGADGDSEADSSRRRPAASLWQRLSRATRRRAASAADQPGSVEPGSVQVEGSRSVRGGPGNGSVRQRATSAGGGVTMNHCSPTSSLTSALVHGRLLHPAQGCSGAGTAFPHFFRQGGRVPHCPHFFVLKFVQKLVPCGNWLLTETQCKIFSVQQN